MKASLLHIVLSILSKRRFSGLMKLRNSEKICDQLMKYDPHVVEIIQFGSSVYAPKYAVDLDLFVFTKSKKEWAGYFDAVEELNLPYNTDIVVNEINEQLDKSFAVSVFGAHKVLYGDGSFLEKCFSEIDPTFEEAFIAVQSSRKYMEDALEADNELLKDRHIRNAFNGLFHASRLAAMTYLSTEDGRWGRIKRNLPKPYQEEFEEQINTLHIEYFYSGNYPEENVQKEFKRWANKVEKFISRLKTDIFQNTF